MYCPRCGDYNQEADRFCSTCGQDLVTYQRIWSTTLPAATTLPQPGSPADPLNGRTVPVTATSSPTALQSHLHTDATAPKSLMPIPTHRGWAAALLALCWPAFWAAIPALVHANRAEERLAAGDTRGAWESSNKAKDWCWVAFAAGLLLWVLLLTLVNTLV